MWRAFIGEEERSEVGQEARWDPWARLSATRRSHLGLMGDNGTRGVLLISLYLLQLLFLWLQKTSLHKDVMREMKSRVFIAFVEISGYSALFFLILNAGGFLQLTRTYFSVTPSFAMSCSGSSSSSDMLDAPGMFTNRSWIICLREVTLKLF